MIQDSGERRKFNSGAVRDIADGKGRCDLLPLDEIAELIQDESVLPYLNRFIRSRNEQMLYTAIRNFSVTAFGGTVNAMLEVAIHYEEGAKKYSERNWEKGLPLHCYLDSGIRHYLKYKRGDKDERHDRAFIWNMLGALYTLHKMPNLDDLPKPAEEDTISFDALMDAESNRWLHTYVFSQRSYSGE